MEQMRAVNPKNHKNLIKTTLKWRILANLELYRKVRVRSDKVFIKFHKNRQNLDRTKMSIYSTITIVSATPFLISSEYFVILLYI